MNDVSIKRIKPGETLPDSNLTFDPDREIWTYAEEQYQVLKRDHGTVRTELKEQTRFPSLGKKSVLMKVRTTHTNAVSRQHWIIGAIIDQHYYQIKINAERFSHLPAIRDAYAKFQSSLSIKPRKKEEK